MLGGCESAEGSWVLLLELLLVLLVVVSKLCAAEVLLLEEGMHTRSCFMCCI